MSDSFHRHIAATIKQIPRGRVATYGQIAAMAGNPLGAREVVRVLHSSSDKHKLPWHRVINRLGKISLGRNQGYKQQKALLEREGVVFGLLDVIDLDRFMWKPKRKSNRR
ncbi:MAG TPA: MGMT family protein [bacterium]|jgi:methylated-DNA-protein-cysteine methyltransferase-like protein